MQAAPVLTEVTQVTARDKDFNSELTYDIVGGNGYNHFSIDSKSGVIHINALLDFERVREYVLAVRARDNGEPPLAAQTLVNITVTDSNDNQPRWPVWFYFRPRPLCANVSHKLIIFILIFVGSLRHIRYKYQKELLPALQLFRLVIFG